MKNFLKRVQENGPAGRKKDMSERVARLGRNTREEIVKWNKMTALRFQTGGGGETSDTPGLPFVNRVENILLQFLYAQYSLFSCQ